MSQRVVEECGRLLGVGEVEKTRCMSLRDVKWLISEMLSTGGSGGGGGGRTELETRSKFELFLSGCTGCENFANT